MKEPPYVETTKDNPTSNKDFTGYIPDLLEKLAEPCNCKFNLHLVGDGKYGVRDERNNWNGMMGEVLHEPPVSITVISLFYDSFCCAIYAVLRCLAGCLSCTLSKRLKIRP